MIETNYSIRPFIDSITGQVKIRVRWNKKKFEVAFVTGTYAEPEKWNSDLKKASKNTTHHVRNFVFSATEINGRIAEFQEAITDCFSQYALKNSIPTQADLKQFVNEELGRVQEEEAQTDLGMAKTFKEVFAEFLKEKTYQKNWDEDAREKYIEAYKQITGAVPDISPFSITVDTMYQIRDWFVNNQYKNRTTNKQLVMVKSIFNWIGQQPEYSISPAVLKFQTNLKVIPKTVTFLKFPELMHFFNYQFSANEKVYAHTRDLWCFMAFTSLRYSDLAALKKAHIIDGERIEMYTQKTDEHIVVPLNEYAKAILERYKDEDNGDMALRVIANQKLNDYIKIAAKIAGLDRLVLDTFFVGTERREESHPFYELISCHGARRTFVSCSLAMGMTPEAVMKCTGHHSYKTMTPYIETAVETQTKEMSKWDKSRTRSQIQSLLEKADENQLEEILALLQAKVDAI